MDIQALFDTMMEEQRETRKKYHLTLGDLIDALNQVDGEMPVFYEFNNKRSGVAAIADSYRGYYSDLAIEPAGNNACTVAELIVYLQDEVLDKQFKGYKGGDFMMETDTPLWIDTYGNYNNIAVIDTTCDANGCFILKCKKVD